MLKPPLLPIWRYFGLITACAVTVISLSGFGYPKAETSIVGSDIRTKNESLYDVKLDAPTTVKPGESFTVRVSFEHDDALNAQARATLVVTNGQLKNEPVQDLMPDAVWKVEAGQDSVVGLVVNIETLAEYKGGNAQAQYIDTLSARVETKAEKGATTKATTPVDIAKAFNKNSEGWVVGGIVLVAVATSLFFWVKNKKRHKL